MMELSGSGSAGRARGGKGVPPGKAMPPTAGACSGTATVTVNEAASDDDGSGAKGGAYAPVGITFMLSGAAIESPLW